MAQDLNDFWRNDEVKFHAKKKLDVDDEFIR